MSAPNAAKLGVLRKGGRAGPANIHLGLRLREAAVAVIDAWRRQQPDLPTRQEAIRRLVERGLQKGKGKAR
jgi:hypothetical protein